MKTLFLAVVIVLGSLSIGSKKAEAGLIVSIVGGGAGGAGVVPGAVLIGAGTLLGVFGGSALTDTAGIVPRKVSAAIGIAGLSLFVVDTDEAVSLENQLPSIPGYVFDTIETVAQLKAEEGTKLTDDVVEVVLTSDEADEILALADDADLNEIQILKDALTTSSL